MSGFNKFINFTIPFLVGMTTGVVINRKREKQTSEQSAREKHAFQLVENSQDYIYHFQVYPIQKFQYLSPSCDLSLGEGTVQESLQNPRTIFNRIHPEDLHILEKKISGQLDYSEMIIQRWSGKDGKYKWFEEHVTPVYEHGRLVAIQGIMRNIDDKMLLQKDLEHRAIHDSLTSLYNRTHFDSLFSTYDEQDNCPIGIILCDLDGLKLINDKHGHKAGDHLLIETANVLKSMSESHTVVSRIGGDEFAILFIGQESVNHLKEKKKHIKTLLDAYDNQPVHGDIRLSMGYAKTAHSKGQMTKLFAGADEALYRNKAKRKIL